MRLLLDEMLSPRIAEQLRNRGHDVTAIANLETLVGQPDAAVLEAAQREGRALVTENVDDFRVLAKAATSRGERHAGLIFASSRAFPRSNRGHIGQMVTALDAVMRADPGMENGELWLRPAEL